MQMENPSASARVESFPLGLRVLVVDDDLSWLKILERMLRKCSYEVTTCCKARVALDLLREKEEKFDIVISDVNMPDMDGFKLLEHVGLELDLPVIMMSVDGETSRVMKGVQHGACDYLLKPIRMKELRNIWQHVYRKRVHEVKDMETHDINEDIHILRNGFEHFDDRIFMTTIEMTSLKKRKDFDTREFSDHELNDPTTMKKARVVWSVDLHQKFVKAVDQIGFDKVGPKKILDLMNVPGLTRENIASHLQKYRMFLGRLQKQNEARAFAGNMQPNRSPEVHSRSLGSENPIPIKENSGADSNGHKSHEIQDQIMIQDVQESGLNRKDVLPAKDKYEEEKENTHPQKANYGPQPGAMLHFKGLFPGTDQKQSWHGSIPLMQFTQYPKHDHEPFSMLENYTVLAPTQEPQAALWNLQCPPSLVSVTSSNEKDESDLDVKSSVAADCEGYHIKILSDDSISVQVEHGVVNSKEFGDTYEHNKVICSKEYNNVEASSHGLIPLPVHTNTENEAGLISSPEVPEEMNLYSVQSFSRLENFAFNGMEMLQHNGCASFAELQSNWYDELEFNCEYWYDYPLLDERLFA